MAEISPAQQIPSLLKNVGQTEKRHNKENLYIHVINSR